MPLFKKKLTTKSPNETIIKKVPAPGHSKAKIGFCSCDEDDQDPVEDDCDPNRGCGKPLFFCGECFLLIKQKDVDQCSCLFTKKKLENSKRGDYSEI